MSQIFRSFEANSGDYLTKMIEKSDSKGLFHSRLYILGQPPSVLADVAIRKPEVRIRRRACQVFVCDRDTVVLKDQSTIAQGRECPSLSKTLPKRTDPCTAASVEGAHRAIHDSNMFVSASLSFRFRVSTFWTNAEAGHIRVDRSKLVSVAG